ncbi:MAG: FecR domain-containing protein [bacterium]
MKQDITKQEERLLSERYSSGVRAARHEREAEVFRTYNRIGDELRSFEVPEFDGVALTNRMAKEMGRGRGWFPIRRGSPVLRPASVLAAVCIVYLAIGFIELYPLLKTPEKQPVDSAKFLNETSSDAPLIWTYRLQRGSLVTVPDGVNAELRLSDGSIISCSPETRIAVRMGADRRITLNSGAIAVQARRIPDSSMTIETPLGNANVVGTTFWIRVVR